jgi:hypothetical protein
MATVMDVLGLYNTGNVTVFYRGIMPEEAEQYLSEPVSNFVDCIASIE